MKYALKVKGLYKSFGKTCQPFRWCQGLDDLYKVHSNISIINSIFLFVLFFTYPIWWIIRRFLPARWVEGTRVNNVLHDINLEITSGQIVALVGPSGCGKSTLLKAICGTHPQDIGQIFAGDKLIEGPCRDIGIVYQDYDLYESMTARQNVAIGLDWDEWTPLGRILHFWKYRKARRDYLRRADELLTKVGLGDHKNKYPGQLSGGQRQRVAICQAIIMRPKVLLLDEPFGALDESTREELQLMLLNLYQENLDAIKNQEEPPYTILIVTHELNEAFYVSDRVIGLSQYHSGNNNNNLFSNEIGATIVYDKPAPVYHPNDPKEFARFLKHKEDVRNYVMDDNTLQDHKQFITFWDDHEKTRTLALKG